jgi:hypothetical protein
MVNTLTKFGVPIDGAKQGPLLQPKLKYRFRVEFLNFGTLGNTAVPLTLNAQSMSFPTLSHDIQEVHTYNSRAYYAGKHQWNPITLTVRDDVTNTVTANIGAQEQRELDNYNQTGYRSATDYKFTTLLEIMDGGNDAMLEQWTCEGCFLSEVVYGDVDYTTSEFRTIQMTIRYDNATLTDGNGNTLMSGPAADPQGSNL